MTRKKSAGPALTQLKIVLGRYHSLAFLAGLAFLADAFLRWRGVAWAWWPGVLSALAAALAAGALPMISLLLLRKEPREEWLPDVLERKPLSWLAVPALGLAYPALLLASWALAQQQPVPLRLHDWAWTLASLLQGLLLLVLATPLFITWAPTMVTWPVDFAIPAAASLLLGLAGPALPAWMPQAAGALLGLGLALDFALRPEPA